jgi:hypothetical protein
MGLGMPFLDIDTCVEGRGGAVIFFYQGFFFMYDAIHGWMTRQMDGWMDFRSCEKASQKTTTTSFTLLYLLSSEHLHGIENQCYDSIAKENKSWISCFDVMYHPLNNLQYN